MEVCIVSEQKSLSAELLNEIIDVFNNAMTKLEEAFDSLRKLFNSKEDTYEETECDLSISESNECIKFWKKILNAKRSYIPKWFHDI